MPSHPDILVRVAEEVRQRIDHVVAVADQHLSCITLQQPVAHERDERRHEQEIRRTRAETPGALNRLSGN
jgi:hypothetical protein